MTNYEASKQLRAAKALSQSLSVRAINHIMKYDITTKKYSLNYSNGMDDFYSEEYDTMKELYEDYLVGVQFNWEICDGYSEIDLKTIEGFV